MITLEDSIKELKNKTVNMTENNNNYNLYKSIILHLEDYKNLLELACRNSVDFESYKTTKEFIKDKITENK